MGCAFGLGEFMMGVNHHLLLLREEWWSKLFVFFGHVGSFKDRREIRFV